MGRVRGRIARLEDRHRPEPVWEAWVPDDDAPPGVDRVRNTRTGELADPAEVRRRPGRHALIEYVDPEETA